MTVSTKPDLKRLVKEAGSQRRTDMQPMFCSSLEGVDWRGSVCRDGARKTKAHSKLNLARDTKGKKKSFYHLQKEE